MEPNHIEFMDRLERAERRDALAKTSAVSFGTGPPIQLSKPSTYAGVHAELSNTLGSSTYNQLLLRRAGRSERKLTAEDRDLVQLTEAQRTNVVRYPACKRRNYIQLCGGRAWCRHAWVVMHGAAMSAGIGAGMCRQEKGMA